MEAGAETLGTGEAEVRAGIQQGAGKDSEGARLEVREQDRDQAEMPRLEAEGGTDTEGLFAPKGKGEKKKKKPDKKKKKPEESSSPSGEPKMKKAAQNKLRDKKKPEESSSSESEGSSSSQSE